MNPRHDEPDLEDIPTLTDVVRPGNPALIFRLDDEETPPPEHPTETTAQEPAPDTGAADGDPLADLGLPEDFFADRQQDPEIRDLFDDQETSPNEAAPASKTPQPPDIPSGPDTLPDTENGGAFSDSALDPEALLIRLEVPIADILQRHWEQAREEILALIREELHRHGRDD